MRRRHRQAKAALRETEQRIADFSFLAKHAVTYRRLKPTYDHYKVSSDKKKFFRGFKSEIILFKASARALKEMGIGKLPSSERLKAETEELTARKAALQTEHKKGRQEEREYDTLRQNVDALLAKPKEQSREIFKENYSESINYNYLIEKKSHLDIEIVAYL